MGVVRSEGGLGLGVLGKDLMGLGDEVRRGGDVGVEEGEHGSGGAAGSGVAGGGHARGVREGDGLEAAGGGRGKDLGTGSVDGYDDFVGRRAEEGHGGETAVEEGTGAVGGDDEADER